MTLVCTTPYPALGSGEIKDRYHTPLRKWSLIPKWEQEMLIRSRMQWSIHPTVPDDDDYV